ncbi:MAG TPA: DUF456 domain-containing protein [Vicinamibacteria bacterium]|nr:DUF456 domain-containing protein [Vicinamibacteria bacterium]
MMTAIHILVGVLFVLGIAGSVLPFLPGTILIWIGALVYAIATDFETLGPGGLIVLGAITGLGYVLDYVAGAVGVERLGGSRWAMLGAIAGAIVGIFFGLPGLLLGPVAGAVLFELWRSRDVTASLKSGMGSVLGVLLGTAAKFTIALIMVGLFFWWI